MASARRPGLPIRTLAILAAAIVLTAAVIGGATFWRHHAEGLVAAGVERSATACATAAKSSHTARTRWDKAADSARRTSKNVSAEKVKDAGTVTALAKELKATAPTGGECTADDEKGLDAAAAALARQSDWYESHAKNLRRAVDAVTASKLDRIVDEANNLLKDSAGKVADDGTRETLSRAVKARNEKAIAVASKAVNDSIHAKGKADADARAKAEAEAQAAQAQADAAQAQAQVPQYTPPAAGSGGWAGGGSTPGRGGGNGAGGSSDTGGWDVPAPADPDLLPDSVPGL
jgi:colicin import membrane protein